MCSLVCDNVVLGLRILTTCCDIQELAFKCTTWLQAFDEDKLVEFFAVENMLLEENEDLLEKASYLEEMEWNEKTLNEDLGC